MQVDFSPSFTLQALEDFEDSFVWDLFLFADDDGGEKTEDPTSKQLSKARDKGNIPKSQDLSMAFILMVVTVAMYALRTRFYGTINDMFLKASQLFFVPKMTSHDFYVYFMDIAYYWYLTMLPLFAIVIIVTLPVQIAQTGLSFNFERFQPDLNRFNPIQGMKKIIGKEALAELVKSLIKLVILGYFPYKLFVDEYQTMMGLFNATLAQDLDYMAWIMVKLILEMGIVLILYGFADFSYSKWKHWNDLKMTKQQVKEEHKQVEGDPQIKAKIRQKQRELSQRQMMGEVPKADVVVTNPTHFAVALRYDRSGGDGAPKVVAKGMNLIAKRIKEIARDNEVPVIENKPLARALFKQVELEQEVPERLYQAVATILAQAYKLKNRKM
jgi:flagellar biosynthetic protein FlhB